MAGLKKWPNGQTWYFFIDVIGRDNAVAAIAFVDVGSQWPEPDLPQIKSNKIARSEYSFAN